MANKPTTSWDETVPNNNTFINQGDDAQRTDRTSVREIVGADHKFLSSGQGTDWGFHNRCTFIEAADIGSGAVGLTLLGSQTVSGKGELVYTDEDNNDIIITTGGFINAAAISTGTFATVALDNLASVAINTSLLPGTDDSIDLGSATKQWKDIYFDDNIVADGVTISAAELARLVGIVNVTLQIKNVQNSAYSAVAQIPYDDTIPQNTEGTEVMTLAITPKSATNLLKIDVVVNGADATSPVVFIGALFQDSTANALAVACSPNDSASIEATNVAFSYYMVAGTTSETTFKVRCGSGSAGGGSFNGSGGARKFGGTMASSITITEYSV
jgi:hypothetical protein